MLLRSTDVLRAGLPYTFTFFHGRIFEYRMDEWVLGQLRVQLGRLGMGEVPSAHRPLFSARYVVTVIPAVDLTLANWLGAFDWAWEHMGYGNATFLQAEGGETSGVPGGISQALPEVTGAVAKTASDIVGSVVRPLAPWLVLLAIILIVMEFRK